MLAVDVGRAVLDAAAAGQHATGQDPKRVREAQRDVVNALAQCVVLVPTADGSPATVPGLLGPMLLSFTDGEAAEAWEGSRHPDAPAVEWARSDELNRGAAPDRSCWLSWLAAHEASAILINPAGPLGNIVHLRDVQTARRRRLSRPIGRQHPWLDPAERRRARDRMTAHRAELTRAVESGNASPFQDLQSRLDEVNPLGSPLWGSELLYLDALNQWRFEDERDGLRRMIFAALSWARFGDPYRAIDALLDVGQRLFAVPSPRADWQIGYINELSAALARLGAGYRGEAVQKLIDAADYAR